MTRDEIYAEYLTWAKLPKSEQSLFDSAIDNHDVYEDENIVLNYLFYQVNEFSNDSIRRFAFCEANLFLKDDVGNLELVYSVLLPSFSHTAPLLQQ